MMNETLRKKFASAALVAVIAAGSIFPAGASAQTAAELTAQINSLLATISSLQAQLASLTGGTPSGAVSGQLTTDLTVGSVGPQVATLQTFLESRGFLVIPAGVSKGYFGALTRNALSAYQSARGISPAAGYFGPITRTRMNAEIAASNPGTVPGTGTTTPPAQNGREGDISVDLLGTPSSENVEKGASNVKVLGFEIEADDSDMTIQRIDVNFEALDPAKNQRPWRYFSRVSIYAGDKRIADMSVTDRSKWSERGDTYQVRFTELDQTVKRGDTDEMYVAVSAQSGIDSRDLGQEWEVSIPDNGIRARDTLGLDQYSGRLEQTFTIEDRTVGSLKLKRANNSPEARVVEADSDSDTRGVDLLAFSLEARNSDIDISEIDIVLETNGAGTGGIADLVKTLRLYRGSTEVASESVSSTTVTFDRLRLAIDKNDTETYTLKADIRDIDGARNGEGVTLAAAISRIEAEDEEGDDVSVSGSAAGKTAAFYTKGLKLALESVAESRSNNRGEPDRGNYTIKFKATAFGDDIYVGRFATEDNDGSFVNGSGVNFSITNPGSNSTNAILTSTAERLTNTFRIREGRTETFTLTVVATGSGSDFAAVALEAVNWGLTDSAALDNFYTFDLGDFATDPLYLGA